MDDSVSTNTAQMFYQSLGKLFYSIAAADGVVSEEEVTTLKEIVKNEWLQLDTIKDEFGTDTAFQIEIIFDLLHENAPKAEDAFLQFKEYKEDHQNLFDPTINQLILKTSDRIAASFAGRNIKELDMLYKLRALLQ